MIRFRFPRPWVGLALSLYVLLGFTLALGGSQGWDSATASPPANPRPKCSPRSRTAGAIAPQ